MSIDKNTVSDIGQLHDAKDLTHLTHVNPDELIAYVRQLNDTSVDNAGVKIVAAIGTGGTISMKPTSDGKLVPDLDFNKIMGFANKHLREKFLVKGFDAFAIDSSQMDYTHAKDLSICISYIWENAKIPLIGFLVLHGTDTMTYSSAAVSIMMGQGLPFSIVYTGSQKPIQEPINDAYNNLHNALYTLESLHDNNMAEVVLVMGDLAVLGTSSEKIDDTQANAFTAPLHKHVARFNSLEYPVKLASWLKPKRDENFEPKVWNGAFSHTLLIKSHLGLCPKMVARQVADKQVKAVVLYSYGGHTVYEPLVDAILPVVKERNLSVFVVSPVNTEIKKIYASAHHMIENGVVPLYMTLSASLAKIEVAIRMFPDNPKAIAEFMTVNYVGEVPDLNSSYSK